MRIALTCNFSPWSSYSGGGQRSTHALACSLSEKGHDVTVIYTKPAWERLEPPANLPYRVRWAWFVAAKAGRRSPLRPLNAFTVQAALKRLHAEKPLDAIHGQGEEVALVRRLGFRGRLRFVLTPRYPAYPRELGPNAPRLARARLWLLDAKYPLLGLALAQADHVCATSQASAAALERAFGYQSSHTRVIPNGVDDCFLDVQWQGPRPDAPLVFFGRIESDKGVDTLLQAMTGIQRELVIIGRGFDTHKYRMLARELGLKDRVHFKEWMSSRDIARLLAESAAAVLPSRAESFGNAMVEAMAAGVPLITTRVGSIPEVVGNSAILVDPEKPAQLTAAIESLLEEPERAVELGRAGRTHVQGRYTWSRVADAYSRLYQEAV